MTYYSRRYLLPILFVGLGAGCKSYNLERATFPTCVKPSATITYAADQLEVTFSLTGKQGDIGAVGWDLGDGQHKTGEQIKIAYNKPGNYTVKVILANACDDTFSTSRSITVSK